MAAVANNPRSYSLQPGEAQAKLVRISKHRAGGILAIVVGLVALVPIVASGMAIAGYLSDYHLALFNFSSLGALILLGMGMLNNENAIRRETLFTTCLCIILLTGFIVANALALAGQFDTDTLGYLIAGSPLGWGFLAVSAGMAFCAYSYLDMMRHDQKIIANANAHNLGQPVPYPLILP